MYCYTNSLSIKLIITEWKPALVPSTSVTLNSKWQYEMFVSVIELLIHLTANAFKPYMLIYHLGANELSSLNLKIFMGGENTPTLAFPLFFRSRMKLRNFRKRIEQWVSKEYTWFLLLATHPSIGISGRRNWNLDILSFIFLSFFFFFLDGMMPYVFLLSVFLKTLQCVVWFQTRSR